MEAIPDYFANREKFIQQKRDRIIAELKKLELGDPIAVELGSTENENIILDTLFFGVTPKGRVRALSIEGTEMRPSIEVVEFDAERVRPDGFRDGVRREGLFERFSQLEIVRCLSGLPDEPVLPAQGDEPANVSRVEGTARVAGV